MGDRGQRGVGALAGGDTGAHGGGAIDARAQAVLGADSVLVARPQGGRLRETGSIGGHGESRLDQPSETREILGPVHPGADSGAGLPIRR